MTFVRSFDDFYPVARFDGNAFISARIEESASAAGPFVALETQPLSPLDANPGEPIARDFTTALATLPAGWYRIVWIDAAAAEFEGDPVPYPAGAPTDLCTLAEVRERRGTPANDVDQDAVVVRVIAAVSRTIGEEYKREFTPSAATTRTFELQPDMGQILLVPYEIRTITEVTTNPDTTPAVLDTGDYRLAPVPAKHGTYHRLRILPDVVDFDATDWETVFVEVTGDWGFASIPPDVREAAIVSVVHNLRTTVGQYSIADGAGGESRYERAELPQAARDLLKPFCRQDRYF